MEPLRAASGPNQFRSDAPIASAVACLLLAEVAVACRHNADAAGLHGDTRAGWEKQLERAVAMVRCCRDDGGLACGDALLTFLWLALKTQRSSGSTFTTHLTQPRLGPGR